jgi:hypothetical protein
MKFQKITHGFVIQTFEDGKCIDQEFIAGDDCEYEANGEPIEQPDYTYQPFNMVQPRTED